MAIHPTKHKRLFLLLFFASAFILFRSGVEVSGQTQEATESIRLYEEIGYTDRVPVITCIDLENSGRLLAIGGDDHFVRLWDVGAKGFVQTLQDHLDWVRGLAFSPDRTRLATIGQDGQIKLWNVKDGSLFRSLKDPVRGTQKIVFQPNGARFAVCGFDNNVRIYDASNGKLLATLPAHGGNNRTIVYSPDGSLLAAAGRTGVVRVWRTSDNQHVADLQGDGRRVNAVAFSPDGSTLATGGDGPFIMLWQTNGTLINTLPERPGKTFSLVFCGPGLLASGESDNVIRLWNVSSGRQVSTFMGHTGTISTMVYEATAGRLISGSYDTTVRFWNIPGGVSKESPVFEARTPSTEFPPEPTTSFQAPPAPASPQESPFANPAAMPEATATPGFPVSF